jgi:hypothetical protein
VAWTILRAAAAVAGAIFFGMILLRRRSGRRESRSPGRPNWRRSMIGRCTAINRRNPEQHDSEIGSFIAAVLKLAAGESASGRGERPAGSDPGQKGNHLAMATSKDSRIPAARMGLAKLKRFPAITHASAVRCVLCSLVAHSVKTGPGPFPAGRVI